MTRAGEGEAAAALAGRAAAGVSLEDPEAVGELVRALAEVEQGEAVAVLAGRAAPVVPLEDPKAIGELVRALAEVEQGEAVAALAGRAASRLPLHHAGAIADLLAAFEKADCSQAVRVVLNRVPGCLDRLDLSDPVSLLNLAMVLMRLGDGASAAVLEQWAADAGWFMGMADEGWSARFPYGREADGSATARWTWRPPDEDRMI